MRFNPGFGREIPMSASATRDMILDAVNRALSRCGLSGITIGAIASEAGVSKGGVLHYFSNKQELLLAALPRFAERIVKKRDEILLTLPQSPSTPLKAGVIALFDSLDTTAADFYAGVGLLGVPVFRDGIGGIKQGIYNQLAEQFTDPVIVAAILLIQDGVWINRIFQPPIIPPELQAGTLRTILELTESHCLSIVDKGGTGGFETLMPPALAPAAPDTRNTILDAAERVLSKHGLAKATLALVAEESGMSKGGVLHHFSRKRELFSTILLRFESRYFARRDSVLHALPKKPCSLARATVMSMLESRRESAGAAYYRIDMLDIPEYRKIIGNTRAKVYRDLLQNSIRPEKMLMAICMLDGLWMHDLFSPPPIPNDMVARARSWLDEYIETLYDDYR